MAAPAPVGKTKGPVRDPALCRCCRSIKKCRILTAEYEWMGNKEVYCDMIMDCFGLLHRDCSTPDEYLDVHKQISKGNKLSQMDGEDKECCICANCVVRLRDACSFRRQVLQCEEVFLTARMEPKEDSTCKIKKSVKTESSAANDCESMMDDRDDLVTATDHEDSNTMDTVDAKELKECDTRDSKKLKEFDEDCQQSQDKKGKPKEKMKAIVKGDRITKVRKLRSKRVNVDKRETAVEKKVKQPTSQTKKSNTDEHDNMVYRNAVTIVLNSYVCPFHNRISIYYCYYCKDQFTNPNELREHTLSHDPKQWFETMMEARKIPKIDVTRIDCRLCDEKIDTIESFKLHLNAAHGMLLHPVSNEFLKFKLRLDRLDCTECGSSFPYFDLLKKHMVEHFGTFVCDMCGACFLEPNSLRTHIRSHNKVDENFPCDICGKNLKSKYSKYLHIATVHEKKATVNCYKCEASFLSYAQRNKHLIEVHGDKRTFPCKSCDKVYNRRKTLMEHNRRIHVRVYRHQCDLCEQRFYLPSRLKEHMATHTGERNFRCEFCEKSYPRLQSLQEHIRSHSNERRYKCDLCNSTFTQNGSLRSHMKSHHQDFEVEGSFSSINVRN